jgi:hypothetical protein
LKARFLRLYPAQSDIPVSVVKKNPLKQIFLTKKGGEKGAFNIYKCRYHGRLSGNAGGDVANP